jgi:hypothetical protein
VILFDDVVQVGTISNLDGIIPTVIEFVIHAPAPQSGMGGFEAIQGNYSRLALALESFTEEDLLRLSRRDRSWVLADGQHADLPTITLTNIDR